LESRNSILLDCVVQEGEWIAVMEQAESSAKHVRGIAARLPGQTETRRKIIARRRQARRHPLPVVTESDLEGQSRRRLPAVLQPEADGERAEARRRISERLEE